MPAPTFTLPTVGTAPKTTSAELLAVGVDAVSSALFDQIGAIATGLTPAGNWSASGGTFPSGSVRGTYYIVSVAGTVGGQAFGIGDWLVPLVSSASTTVYAANWFRGDYSKVVPAGLPKKTFATVANLTADVTVGYSAATVIVVSGDILVANGFRYQVAASGATDHHLTTAGGVKLYVLAGNRGYNLGAWGLSLAGIVGNSAKLQSAFDTIASAGGGTIIQPKGLCRIDSQVTLPSNLEWVGEPGAIIAPSSSVAQQAIYSLGKSNITLRGLEVTGTGAAYTDGLQNLVWFEGGSDITVERCKVTKSRNGGILFDAVDGVRVTRTRACDNYGTGITIRNECSDVVISKNRLHNNGDTGTATSAAGRGVVVWECTDVAVQGCSFKGNTEYGFRVFSDVADTSASRRVRVWGCDFYNNGSTGTGRVDLYLFAVNGVTSVEDVTVGNCTFRTLTGNTAISVQGGGVTVTGCTLKADTAGGGTPFFFYKAEDCVVTGCKVKGFASAFGFSGTAGAIPARITIAGNSFTDVDVVSAGPFGDGHVIEGNYFKRRTAAANQAGLQVNNALVVGARVRGNTFDGFWRVAEFNLSLCGVEFVGNKTKNTTDVAIRCYGTDLTNLIFHSNVFDVGTNPTELGRLSLQGGISNKVLGYGNTIPSGGGYTFTYRRGDTFWNYDPTASGTIGWTCTTGGTPGTWKAFGTIAA